MGNRASSQLASQGGSSCWQTTVSIIHLDGRLEQLKEKMQAGHFLSQNPNCFMCCSESMFVGSLIPRVDPSEELQLDHIYFLMPLSKSHVPLSLEDLCKLAIKAHAALAHSQPQLCLEIFFFTKKLPKTSIVSKGHHHSISGSLLEK